MGKRHRDEDDESSSSSSSDESGSESSSSSKSSGNSSDSDSEESRKKHKKDKKVDKNLVEEEEKEKNREATKNRSRMWQLVSSESEEEDGKRGKKDKDKDKDKSHHHHHHHHKDKDSHGSSHKKRKKESKKHDKKHKKDKKKEDKKKKKKKHHHSEKKHKSKKKEGVSESMRGAVDMNLFGSRGIIKESDFARKKHDFEIWMDEVKGVPMLPSSKWEVMKYFRQYMEDYNTATFPSEKYYDVDKWEMDAMRKQQDQERFKQMRAAGTFNDEAQLAAEKKKEREKQEKGEVAWALSMMSQDKRQAIIEQQALQAKMQAAYKAGDMKLVRQIEYQLLPDEEKQKMKRNDRPTYD